MTNYKCEKCGYSQDFEPTQEKLNKVFPECKTINANECPSCYLRKEKIIGKLKKVTTK